MILCKRCKLRLAEDQFPIQNKKTGARFKTCVRCRLEAAETRDRVRAEAPRQLAAMSNNALDSRTGSVPRSVNVPALPSENLRAFERLLRQRRDAAPDIRRVDLLNSFTTANAILQYAVCIICQEGRVVSTIPRNLRCDRCNREASSRAKEVRDGGGSIIFKFSAANDMDPGPVPSWLPNLTKVEQMLLALVHPIVSIFRVTGGQWKGGKVHCISFAQDPTEVFTSIPRLPVEVAVIIIRKRGAVLDCSEDFRVNAHRLCAWMYYLRRSNRWYRHITIDDAALAHLDEFDRQPGGIQRLFEVNEDDGDEENGAGAQGAVPDGPDGPRDDAERAESDELRGIVYTGAYRSRVNVNERATLQRLLRARPASQPAQRDLPVIAYPTIGVEPINEYTTEGYIVRAFPTLFPSGACDLRDNSHKA
jgi:hypothetical protein